MHIEFSYAMLLEWLYCSFSSQPLIFGLRINCSATVSFAQDDPFSAIVYVWSFLSNDCTTTHYRSLPFKWKLAL